MQSIRLLGLYTLRTYRLTVSFDCLQLLTTIQILVLDVKSCLALNLIVDPPFALRFIYLRLQIHSPYPLSTTATADNKSLGPTIDHS